MSTYQPRQYPTATHELTQYLQGEHNTTDPAVDNNSPRRRRPDLSTFFATLSEITPAPDHRPHAVPVPGDVSAAFYSLAEAFEVMRRQAADLATERGDGADGEDLLNQMIQSLLSEADTPPREVEGVSDEFCDSKKPSFTTFGVFKAVMDIY